MIAWLSLAGAVVVTAVAAVLQWGRRTRPPSDPGWDDWPPDQMAR